MRSNLINFISFAVLSLSAALVSAQDAKTAKLLVNQGIALNDSGKYAQAVEKYSEALKADPNDLQADYEMGFSLYNEGKGLDAVPFLEKILASNDSKYETYDLLGSIYDDNNQPDKAIDCYIKGIADYPKYERLHFNLGISYLRQKKYTGAEDCESDAIKLDPKHASAQRIYAMAEYEEGNHTRSLLAWCSFLLLEPNTQRSAGAFDYIKAIINYGVTRKSEKAININVSEKDLKSEDFILPITIVASTEDKGFESKKESAVDSLTVELTSVFQLAAEHAKSDTGFYANYLAKYFGKLADSGNVPAFARFISLGAYKDDDLAWFKANKKQLDDLDMWVQTTQRGF
jgi:tetratricopeptide (TPR) repeat protein